MESNLTVTNSQRRQFPTVLLAAHVHSNKLICLINREEQQGPRNRHKGFFFPRWKRKLNLTARERNGRKEVDTEQWGRIAVSPSTADGDEICWGENCRKKERTDERGKKCQRVAKVGCTVRGKRFYGGKRGNGEFRENCNKHFDMEIDSELTVNQICCQEPMETPYSKSKTRGRS